MPRAPIALSFGCDQSSLPVSASSATISLSRAATYIVRSTIRGLNENDRSPLGKVQATSSRATFDLSICLSAEYCDECAPPPYSLHVVYVSSACAATWRDAPNAIEANRIGARVLVLTGIRSPVEFG